MKNQTISNSVMCAKGLLERPRYFPRQLITPAEMTLEQDYFRQKMRLHNRMLHGWGVVCGAKVCEVPEQGDNGNGTREVKPWYVKVKPGYVLGPYGDDIVIDCEHEIDLRTHGMNGVTGEPPEQALDPWCSDVTVKRDDGPLYIAVKYKESMTRPVRVQPVGCGCDDTQCEYSRWCDGYEIGILDECPPSHAGPPPDLDFKGEIPACPDCPEDPWVVLAKVTIDEDGAIEEIDNCSCRRLVVALGNHWWRCEHDLGDPAQPNPQDPPRVIIDAGRSSTILDQGSEHDMQILKRVPIGRTEVHFESATTGASTGIDAVAEVKPDSLLIKFKIKSDAEVGPWTARIFVSGNEVMVLPDVITVQKKVSGQPPRLPQALIDGAKPPVDLEPGSHKIEISGDLKGASADKITLIFKPARDVVRNEIKAKVIDVRPDLLLATFETDKGLSAGPWAAIITAPGRPTVTLPDMFKIKR